jgi:response regulator RpfG family c-di-GMP phosphodiesterase
MCRQDEAVAATAVPSYFRRRHCPPPDRTGLQLCRAIRQLDPHGPVIFCTGAARDQGRNRALRAGANVYLCKPIDPEKLRRQVRVYLELSELESLRARVDEERAIQGELERRIKDAAARTDAAQKLASASIGRTARTKAFKAFIEARGTRAHFESWWAQVFGNARTADSAHAYINDRPPRQP